MIRHLAGLVRASRLVAADSGRVMQTGSSAFGRINALLVEVNPDKSCLLPAVRI